MENVRIQYRYLHMIFTVTIGKILRVLINGGGHVLPTPPHPAAALTVCSVSTPLVVWATICVTASGLCVRFLSLNLISLYLARKLQRRRLTGGAYALPWSAGERLKGAE